MDQDLPLGFGMALAQNPQAMEYFATLPDEKKQQIIDKTHAVRSRREMHAFVQTLAESSFL